MPLSHYFVTDHRGRLGIWDITEPDSYFLGKWTPTDWESDELSELQGNRRLEWLAARYLVQLLSGGANRVAKDEWGKPHLQDSPYEISISHSDKKVAVIIGIGLVGVDIQTLQPKLARIAWRVIREEKINNLDEHAVLEQLHVYWGAKESLYKAYGMRELDFRKNTMVTPFRYLHEGGQTLGRVKKGEFEMNFDVYYQLIEKNYILVYAMQKD